MFTQCPACQSLFKVTADNLRTQMGMVRCTQCEEVFNALTGLREEQEIDTSQAEDVGNQLAHVQEFGDEQVIDARFLASQEWFTTSLGPTPADKLAKAEASGAKVRAASAAVPVPGKPKRPIKKPVFQEAQERASEAELKEPWGAQVLRAVLGQTASLALRNLSRHRRRTALGIGAIGFGVIALVLAGGFAEWMQWAERESTIHSRLGHIQIVKKGYYENGVADPYQYLIPDAAVNSKRLTMLPHVKTVTPRIAFSGLISKGETTVSFLGEGVAP